jgi:hypothetical protein
MARPFNRSSVSLVCGVCAMILSAAGWADQATRVNPEAKALASFQDAVREYVELHRKLESTLPPVPKEAANEVVYQHERALERLIQQARSRAKQGDIFTRESRPVIRRLLTGLFRGPEGPELRAAIKDEDPGARVKLRVNSRYPDAVPLSSMPPQLLKVLPPLPEELDYRYVGEDLILLDTHAHTIVDILSDALPR